MGEHVPEGTRVKLVVAAGSAETKEKVVEVIRVVSLPLDDAEANLRRVHLKLGQVTEVYDDKAPKGEVVAQDVPPGTEVAEWQEIGLTVSKGPQPPAVEGTETTGPGDEQPPEGKAGADSSR
jgi:serine/threonine-protein kinase